MALTPVLEPTKTRPTTQHLTGPGSQVFLKNSFSLITLILFGAVLQSILVLILPLRFALAPAAVVFAVRILDHVLMIYNLKPNQYMSSVLLGKYSYQVPDSAGRFSDKPSDEPITVFMLSARSNHPAGVFAPGFAEMGKYMRKMDQELEAMDPTVSGFLGKTLWTNGTDRDGGNEVASISYWRSPEHIHAYAHGKTHSEAWDWFNKEVLKKGINYIGISHDLFAVPKGHWENIYINMEPTSLGAARFLRKGDKSSGEEDVWVRGIVDARKGQLRHSAGRLTWGTEQHEKYIGSELDV
ncbi:MAG: hypothetical protein Q9160_007162 [Pyrenula sp. 1 TL-2023]